MTMLAPKPIETSTQSLPGAAMPVTRHRLALSPLNRRRWQNFKANRRGYWSLWIFLILFGLSLFAELIAMARTITPKIERIELVVREGLAHAIRLYERVGFRQEGRFERRFRLSDGKYEADLPMVLFLS